MDTHCVFCKIVQGEVPCYKVYEDERCLAFLDIYPLRPGHVLVIPKRHEPDFWELQADEYQHCMTIAQSLAKHIKSRLATKRVGLIITGFDVPHTHIHLIPLNSEKELTSQSLKASGLPYPSAEEFADMAEKIRM